MLERLDNTITQITAVHAPVIALFRYFVIYCDSGAFASYPSIPRMGRTLSTTHPWYSHDIPQLHHSDNKWLLAVTVLQRYTCPYVGVDVQVFTEKCTIFEK